MERKTAIVTGATSGIGRATALRFAKLGINLIITGRRAERLHEFKKELGTMFPEIKVKALCFDIRDREQVEAQDFVAFGSIDYLVNNAGLAAGLEHIDQGDPLDWDAMIDTNVKGVLYITRLVSKVMIAQHSGHIINIGSIAGIQAYENGAAYCASKHAMHALSQGMRLDFLSHGIKVSQVRPGMVETEFSQVRFHGDAQRAAGVYKGVTPLTGDDIAAVIEWIVTLPAHVNINDIEVMPSAQANAYTTFRG